MKWVVLNCTIIALAMGLFLPKVYCQAIRYDLDSISQFTPTPDPGKWMMDKIAFVAAPAYGMRLGKWKGVVGLAGLLPASCAAEHNGKAWCWKSRRYQPPHEDLFPKKIKTPHLLFLVSFNF